jgi:hypothetical protein
MEVSKISNINPWLPWISGILLPIHPKLFQDCQVDDHAFREGCQVQMESTM